MYPFVSGLHRLHHRCSPSVVCCVHAATGYLQKKAKTGKWQKRWFETNAHYRTYYKVPNVHHSRVTVVDGKIGSVVCDGAQSFDEKDKEEGEACCPVSTPEKKIQQLAVHSQSRGG